MKALIDADHDGVHTPRVQRAWLGIKLCNVCFKDKPYKDFHPNKSCTFGVTGTCRECNYLRISQWYKDNRAKRQLSANQRNRDNKAKAVEYLGGSCSDCFGVFPNCVYDFHHVDGTKEKNPSAALAGSFDKAVEELDKCVLLCANCHRIRHFGGEL